MKNLFIKTIALSIMVIMLAISCKKDGLAGAPGSVSPKGQSLTGNKEGAVFVYDDGAMKQILRKNNPC